MNRLPKKFDQKIETLRNAGRFTQGEVAERGMFFATGDAGTIDQGRFIRFYAIVDPEDGMIVDCKYQLIGSPVLIFLAEGVAEFVIHKNYDQAKRVTLELIGKHLLEEKKERMPDGAIALFALIKNALENLSEECKEIKLPTTYVSPVPHDLENKEELPPWDTLGKEEKLFLIEKILSEEIRPYIEMDEGGISLLDLKEKEIVIAYEGSCTSCYSSIGSTLSSIQEILRAKLHPELVVTPNMDNFTF